MVRLVVVRYFVVICFGLFVVVYCRLIDCLFCICGLWFACLNDVLGVLY